MNTLHAVGPVFAEGAPMPLFPTCSNCGSHAFIRLQTESSSVRYSIVFRRDGDPQEDWDTRDSDVTDSEPWACWDCDIPCDDDLSDLIDFSR